MQVHVTVRSDQSVGLVVKVSALRTACWLVVKVSALRTACWLVVKVSALRTACWPSGKDVCLENSLLA